MSRVRVYEYRRRKPGKKSKRLTKVERYISKVKTGSGSRNLKEWLSRPMDAFVGKKALGAVMKLQCAGWIWPVTLECNLVQGRDIGQII
jgi:hypothetical protein